MSPGLHAVVVAAPPRQSLGSPVSQRLQMASEAAGQGRDDVAVAQLRSFHVDVAEQPRTERGEPRAPQQHMLRCSRQSV